MRRLPPATVTSPRGLARGLRLPQPPRGLPSPVGHRPVPLREAQSPGAHRQQQQQQPGAAPGRPHGGPAWLWAPRRARHRPGGGERRQGARPRGRDQKKRRKLQWGCSIYLFIFFFFPPPSCFGEARGESALACDTVLTGGVNPALLAELL